MNRSPLEELRAILEVHRSALQGELAECARCYAHRWARIYGENGLLETIRRLEERIQKMEKEDWDASS